MRAILEGASDGDATPVLIEGFIGPAHVSTVIGTRPTSLSRATTASRW